MNKVKKASNTRQHHVKVIGTKSKKTKKETKTSDNVFRRIPSYVLWSLLVLVVIIYCAFFYRTFVTPYSFRWKALYGTTVYPDGKVRGIDISHYQDDIDWDKLRNASISGTPVSFIFVKATEGANLLDVNFNQNFYYARKHEFVRGAYHFFSTHSSAEKQARYFCKMVQLEDDDLPPVLDVETIEPYSIQTLQSEVLKWLQIVEKHYGVTPILYTSYKFRTDYLGSPAFDKYYYWIAHYYVKNLTYQGKWHFWQHTDAGKIDGIKGYVDINVFNGTYKQLMQLTVGQQRK